MACPNFTSAYARVNPGHRSAISLPQRPGGKKALCLRALVVNSIETKNGNELPAALFYPLETMQMNGSLSNAKIVSPQRIQLNGAGPAIFQEQSSCFSVQIPIGFLKNWKERKDAEAAQVWLLKTDGTLVPQCARPFVFSMGALGEDARDYQFNAFTKVPEEELASVIVSYDGRLYCHEIRKFSQP
jgi:hypothetical protein